MLDVSNIQLDETHTPTKRGEQAVAYEGRKKCKTSNMLIITDSNGIPLACSGPIDGNHIDAFELVKNVDNMLDDIRLANISTQGLFLNAYAGLIQKSLEVLASHTTLSIILTRINAMEKKMKMCLKKPMHG